MTTKLNFEGVTRTNRKDVEAVEVCPGIFETKLWAGENGSWTSTNMRKGLSKSMLSRVSLVAVKKTIEKVILFTSPKTPLTFHNRKPAAHCW